MGGAACATCWLLLVAVPRKGDRSDAVANPAAPKPIRDKKSLRGGVYVPGQSSFNVDNSDSSSLKEEEAILLCEGVDMSADIGVLRIPLWLKSDSTKLSPRVKRLDSAIPHIATS